MKKVPSSGDVFLVARHRRHRSPDRGRHFHSIGDALNSAQRKRASATDRENSFRVRATTTACSCPGWLGLDATDVRDQSVTRHVADMMKSTRMIWWTTPAPGIECAKG
jgi:hypothetical protein